MDLLESMDEAMKDFRVQLNETKQLCSLYEKKLDHQRHFLEKTMQEHYMTILDLKFTRLKFTHNEDRRAIILKEIDITLENFWKTILNSETISNEDDVETTAGDNLRLQNI